MERTIRAKFKNGVIEPLEKLELEEGEEFLITVRGPRSKCNGAKRSPSTKIAEAQMSPEDRFEKAMGSWKGTIDCEQLIKDIYESRRLSAGRDPPFPSTATP